MPTSTFPLHIRLHSLEFLASHLGYKSYDALGSDLYNKPTIIGYTSFTIPKKNGKERLISSPNRKLKQVQQCTADLLNSLYTAPNSAHAFTNDKSILTNAKPHVNKKHVFNIDLESFFPSITFARVRYLLAKKPYLLPINVATVIAHIVTHKNKLPQGAPTSPVISNMICARLDKELTQLAKKLHCTYTRYCDDITFSFTCSYGRIPREIVSGLYSTIQPGDHLVEIIETNGFSINKSKTRLRSSSQRMEVTGLTVNEFPNVKRSFIKRIQAILYSWENHGYSNTETVFHSKHYTKHRASDKKPTMENVLRGMILFVMMVRGNDDHITIKLAKKYNALCKEENIINYLEKMSQIDLIFSSLFIIKIEYDIDGEGYIEQGTGFYLEGKGLVTCAHTVMKTTTEIHSEIKAFQHNKTSTKYDLIVEKHDHNRDIAICSLKDSNGNQVQPEHEIKYSRFSPLQNLPAQLIGFPAYSPGQTPIIVKTQVSGIIPDHGVTAFEIATQIRKGNSGGPVLDDEFNLLGIAARGASQDFGKNMVIMKEEIDKVAK